MTVKKEPNQVILNIHFIKNKIVEESIKQWWLAEQVGVDAKTLRRWLQGKIKGVRIENAKSLASVLECQLADITLTDDTQLYATEEDQKNAASLLASSSLIEKLGPIGEWDVIESLIKSTVVPNLPKFVLGELYSDLSIASWRQSKIDQAHVYAMKANEIAKEIGDKRLLALSLMSLANISCWRGSIKDSIKTYKSCIELSTFLEEGNLASIYSNLGALYWEIGLFDDALSFQNKAKTIFKELDKKMNLSIAHCQLSFIFLEKGELPEALEHTETSIMFARDSFYKRGIEMGKLVKANILALQGENDEALNFLESGMDGFRSLGIDEGFNFEFAGRVMSLLGEFIKAEKFFQYGISISSDFPLYLANLYKEYGKLLLKDKNEHIYGREYLSKAVELYTKVGAEARANEIANLLKIIDT